MPLVHCSRLAGHLASAFAIYVGLVWTTLSMTYPTPLLASVSHANSLIAAKKLRGWGTNRRGERLSKLFSRYRDRGLATMFFSA